MLVSDFGPSEGILGDELCSVFQSKRLVERLARYLCRILPEGLQLVFEVGYYSDEPIPRYWRALFENVAAIANDPLILSYNDKARGVKVLSIMAANIIIMLLSISYAVQFFILFQLLEVGLPVKVVVLHIGISAAIVVHHVNPEEVALLGGGE